MALDLELSHELRLAGLLREIIRLLQDGRKNGSLELSDWIELWWRIGGPRHGRRATYQDRFAAEALATSVHRASRASRTRVQVSNTELGLQVWARKA